MESFENVVAIFLGNHKNDNYRKLVNAPGVFPDNLGAVSDEQLRGSITTFLNHGKAVPGHRSPNILADYCWTFKRGQPEAKFKKILNY